MNEEQTSLTVQVPSDVFEFIEIVKAEDPITAASIEKMTKLARKEGLKEVAKWIKNNPIAYGVGYWNGFEAVYESPNDQDKTPDNSEDKTPDKKPAKRKRKRIPPQDKE